MEKVTIQWHGPYIVEQVQDEGVASEFGIYAIYRRWGESNKLIYIGETYAARKDFWARLQDHRGDWLDDVRGTKTVCFGTIVLEEGQKSSERRIKDAEALLIWTYKPPYNRKSIKSYRGRELEIINLGRRGLLGRALYSST